MKRCGNAAHLAPMLHGQESLTRCEAPQSDAIAASAVLASRIPPRCGGGCSTTSPDEVDACGPAWEPHEHWRRHSNPPPGRILERRRCKASVARPRFLLRGPPMLSALRLPFSIASPSTVRHDHCPPVFASPPRAEHWRDDRSPLEACLRERPAWPWDALVKGQQPSRPYWPRTDARNDNWWNPTPQAGERASGVGDGRQQAP
mmetsp:Transcript_84606/g.236069  ORF Transcript_84606/g.236069 Transcript_84606/m.236069 type:complete len:203 (+) Transcript_84606:1109-1717(+)